MKKITVLLAVVGLVLFPAGRMSADGIFYDGNPMDYPNHFVWDLMAELQTPDDPDCETLALAALIDGGLSEEEATDPAEQTCLHLAEMRTRMQSDMEEGGGNSVASNLFDAENWHNLENLYFEHSTNGVPDGKISFGETIDFMSYGFLNFMSHFGDNMEARTGYISLDASTVGGFANYGATLTMYNVPEFNDPVILVNGGNDNEGIVSNLAYDEENNTITFSAAHFTSFEVAENSEEPELDKISAKKFFNPNLGQWRVKVKIKGDEFDNSTEMTAGGRDAYKVKKHSGQKIVAYFSLEKLERAGRDKFTIKVKNGSETEKFEDRLTLSELTTDYARLD